MVLVDTSVLIDFFKDVRNSGTEKMDHILSSNIPFGINSFIYQEILQGAKSEKEFDTLKEYLECQRFYVPLDPKRSFEEAALIYFNCRKEGISIRSTIDCVIAQTTIEHQLFLLHNDRDFDAMAKIIKLKFF